MSCFVMMDEIGNVGMISGQHALLAFWRLDLAGVARMLIKPCGILELSNIRAMLQVSLIFHSAAT